MTNTMSIEKVVKRDSEQDTFAIKVVHCLVSICCPLNGLACFYPLYSQ